ncbi:mechanosensitive ion channel domain-containing protein [Allorhodopirellula heiligendammensis]|uniref:Miniconductance mechanosensitive channel MscM n=1 Tax=Allorhodopirellula heiligendammensis TaxID=2714739 RepID=A0A5C6BFN8_9BACT|nr:mechanosensitive ion channel domain-containing protein [Allorhodopirellula heiligendammensis]TWU10502.1 Miniconductance mechanosensitive channel MscM precursor [Allorhodopirellula heiligendammensis]
MSAKLIFQSPASFVLGVLIALTLGSPRLHGQDAGAPEVAFTEQSISVEAMERVIADLTSRTDIDSGKRVQALENYQSALNNLKSAVENEARRVALVGETESISEQVERLKQQRAGLKDQKPVVQSGLALQEMEQLLAQWDLLLATHKKTRQTAELELQTRSQRRKEIRALIVSKEQRIADAVAQLQSLAAAENSLQSNSLAARLLTRRMTLSKELPALQAELAKYDAEDAADLQRLRFDLATIETAYREKCIELLQQRINAAREAEAEQSIRRTRYEAIAAAPSLKDYAEKNQELAEKTKALAEQLVIAQQEHKLASELHESLIAQFNRTRAKVKSVGMTSSVGALLRKEKKDLPDLSSRRAAVALRQPLINDTQYSNFDYEDQRREVGDAKSLLAKISSDAGDKLDTRPGSVLDTALMESAAEDLIARRSETLDTLVRSNDKYFDQLIELDMKDRQLIKLAAEYENYIDERVLWIRSSRPLTTELRLDMSDTWLVNPAKWMDVAVAFAADIRSKFYLYVLVLVPWGVLLARGSFLRRQIAGLGEIANRVNCRSILPTLRTMALTLVVSLVWPTLCALIAWRLERIAGDSEFMLAISNGFYCLSIVWFATELIRQSCRPLGLGEAHFRWSTHATQSVRRGLRSVSMIAFPLTFVTATLCMSNQSRGHDTLERLFFVAGMFLVASLVFRLLTPSGVLRDYFNVGTSEWSDRGKRLWSIVGVCLPLSLAGLAIAGYYYTAEVLSWRLFETCGFLIGLLVVRSLLFRMLLLRRRYLSIEQSRQRAAALASSDEPDSPMVAGILAEDAKADISAQSEQSRRLINTGMIACSIVGLWMIWVQVLPALSMLDKYEVWSATQVATTSNTENSAEVTPVTAMMPAADSAGDDGPDGLSDQNKAGAITLSDLVFALLIVVVTFVLFRNGPGLLEITVLQQLPVDASVRYAITTLVSYAIVLIGTIAACSTIGLKWSQIQWLATALTFGLAFGLQEMFANFVAGLIILLERPIRVGDIVTVDDVSGVVSRIRIRATSITNWDRKEYVVPNKEFITGRLLNWTLSDKVNRIVINVGVSYESDTERARELLLRSAKEHPLVLTDPPPVACFEGFGDSALNMVLRVYLPSLDNRLEVIHQLHTSINKAFRAEGIRIPFPQRDLHVRTTPAALGLSVNADSSDHAAAIDRTDRATEAA